MGESAFQLCKKLTSVTIPSGVTSIEDYAFDTCTGLTDVTIPSSVTTIGAYAFFDCAKLKDIWYHGTEAQWKMICSNNGDAPAATVVHYVLSITAASDPAEGGTVTISSVPGAPAVSGPGKAWSNTDVTLTATPTPNSNYAFVNWTENVNGSVTTVSTDASYSFTATTDRDLVANFAQIVASGYCGGEGDGTNLTWVLDNNGTLTISGTGAMDDGQKWYDQRGDIKSAVIENGVTSIGYGAFEECSLQSIEIPASVTTIGYSAFGECDSLESVTFIGGSKLTSIGDNAFQGCGNLGSIEIPSSVTSIGAGAFWSCDSLKSIEIPKSVKTIGDHAFEVCDILEDVTFVVGSELTTIGDRAFNACDRLKSIEIPKSVKTIGDHAFEVCDSLESVTFVAGSELTTIGASAFKYCDSLKSIEIPAGVTTIGDYAFSGCANLTNVTIERSDIATVLAIGSDAFLCGTDSATLSWTGDLSEDRCVVFEVSPDSAGYSIKNGTTLSWSDITGEATLTAHFAQPATATLQVTKELNNWRDGDSFTFELAPVDNAPMPASTTARATKAKPEASFGEITYNSVGTYKYTIAEVNGHVPGVIYDTTPRNVVVTVSKDGNNKLSADVKYDRADSLIITNIYATAAAPTIDKQPTALSWTYGDTTTKELSVSASVSDGGTLSYQWYLNTADSTTGGTEVTGATRKEYTVPGGTETDAGTYYYYCVVTNTENGATAAETSNTAAVTVRAADITITMADRTLPYNGQTQYGWSRTDAGKETVTGLANNETVTITYTPASGLAVGSETSGVYDGSTLKIKDGDKDVTGNYDLKTLTAGKLTISKKPVTVTAANQSVELNGSITPFASDPAMATLSGAVNGHSLGGVTLTASGTADVTTSGTVTPSDATIMNGSENVTANYEIGYGNGTLTVTRTQPVEKDPPTAAAVTYGDKLSTITGSMKDKYTGNEVPGSFAWKTPDAIPAVSDSNKTEWTFTPTDDVNYAPVTGFLTLTVSPRSVTVKADDKSSQYGAAIQPLSFTVTVGSLVDGDTPESLGVTAMTAATSSSNVGPYDIVLSGGTGNPNYSVTLENGTYTVTKTDLTVTAASWAGVYDGTGHGITVDVGSSGAAVWYSGTAELTPENYKTAGARENPAYTAAGEYKVWYYVETANYEPVPVKGSQTVNITCAPLTITADSAEKAYDGSELSCASWTAGGLAEGDRIESVTTTGSRVDVGTGENVPSAALIRNTAGEDVTACYEITYRNGTLTVTKPTPTAPTADGTPQALVIPPQELPTDYTGVKYSIDGGTNWTELNVVPTAIVPDTYVVQVLYVPDGNHTAFEGTPVKAVILPNYYVVEAESTSAWMKGSRDDAVIKVRLRGLSGKDDNSFQHFKSVAIDGAGLSEDSSALIQKDYKAEEGSTVITLHKKMLNRLSAGPHTVTITFDNGEVEAPLTILVPPGGYSPATGDSARIGFWAALMVFAGLGFAGADYARRKFRRPRYVGKH